MFIPVYHLDPNMIFMFNFIDFFDFNDLIIIIIFFSAYFRINLPFFL